MSIRWTELSAGTSRESHNFLCAVLHAYGDGEVQAAFAQNLLANLDVGSFHANDDGNVQLQILGSGDDAGGNNVATHDAAKNIDEDGFNFAIAHQNTATIFDLFLRSAPPDLLEIP